MKRFVIFAISILSSGSYAEGEMRTVVEQRSREIHRRQIAVGPCYDTGYDGFGFGDEEYAFDLRVEITKEIYLVQAVQKDNGWGRWIPVQETFIEGSAREIKATENVTIRAGVHSDSKPCESKRAGYVPKP
ncbi:MAG: hypothetical protein AB7G93_02265 [Bdellovibrionales bacterium]